MYVFDWCTNFLKENPKPTKLIYDNGEIERNNWESVPLVIPSVRNGHSWSNKPIWKAVTYNLDRVMCVWWWWWSIAFS